MDSFKTGAGILSIVNLVIEISLGIYIVNTINSIKTDNLGLKNDNLALKNDFSLMGKKILEVENRTVQISNVINEITKTVQSFKVTRNELIAGVNELHQFKAVTDERLDLIEQNLDLIITVLEEKDIKVPVPKPKPQSRFGRKHVLVDEQKVSFGKPISKHKVIDDEVPDDDDDDPRAALKAYRNNKS